MKTNTSYAEEISKAQTLKKGIFDTATRDYDLELDRSKSIMGVMEVYFARRKGSKTGEKRELRVCYDDRKLFINAIVLEGIPDDIEEFGRLAYYLREFLNNENWKYRKPVEITQPFSDAQFEYRRARKLLALGINKSIRDHLEELEAEKSEKERRERLAHAFDKKPDDLEKIVYPSDD